MTEPSWRQIADRLAARMVHHAYCPEPHHEEHPDPDECPFCADVAALKAYQDKRRYRNVGDVGRRGVRGMNEQGERI